MRLFHSCITAEKRMTKTEVIEIFVEEIPRPPSRCWVCARPLNDSLSTDRLPAHCVHPLDRAPRTRRTLRPRAPHGAARMFTIAAVDTAMHCGSRSSVLPLAAACKPTVASSGESGAKELAFLGHVGRRRQRRHGLRLHRGPKRMRGVTDAMGREDDDDCLAGRFGA